MKKYGHFEPIIRGAFSKFAYSELRKAMNEETAPGAIYDAGWRFARLALAMGLVEESADSLERLKTIAPSKAEALNFSLFEMETSRQLGHVDQAISIGQQAIERHGLDPRLCYALSGLYTDTSDRLAWINKPIVAAGYAPIVLSDHSQPLSIYNVQGEPSPFVDGPKVSVIMPTYNCAEIMQVAAASILAQTWTNLELIVVDDLSTDDTWDVIQDLAVRDKRVIPLRNEQNSGAYHSRNRGLVRATGDFITVNDADDWSHPQRIACQMNAAIAQPDTINETYGARVMENLVGTVKPRSGTCVVENTSTLLYPRKLIEVAGCWEESRFSADSELQFRARQITGEEELRLEQFIPLAFMLTRAESLTSSGPTALVSLHYGARREYAEASRYWRSITPSLHIVPGSRPFPVPRIARERTDEPIDLDLLLVSDFSVDSESNLGRVEQALSSGRRFGLFHWPRFEQFNLDVHLPIRKLVHDHWLPMIVSGERVSCETVMVLDPLSLEALPDLIPQIAAKRCIVLDDGSAVYDAEMTETNARGLCERVFFAPDIDDVERLVTQEEPDTLQMLSREVQSRRDVASLRAELTKARSALAEEQDQLEKLQAHVASAAPASQPEAKPAPAVPAKGGRRDSTDWLQPATSRRGHVLSTRRVSEIRREIIKLEEQTGKRKKK